jgi:hypothetical protein
MAIANAAEAPVKTVSDPNAAYDSLKSLWLKSRAACSGERFVKDYDAVLDVAKFSNLLIPFSPSMTTSQYAFYKAEAEWPGITAQYSKILVGGLLRKSPQLTLPENVSPDIHNWIMNEFGMDDSSLVSFMDSALWEEMQTSRAWVFVDHPNVDNVEDLTPEQRKQLKPYPILHKAENIINWRTCVNEFGKRVLESIIVRGYTKEYIENPFHPTMIETVWVHEVVDNRYQVREFRGRVPAASVAVVAGQTQQANAKLVFELHDTVEILVNGESIPYIPAWPLNGSIEALEPMLSPIIDKEVSLYNKLSRRNHLLYGASTYTPIISSDMSDEAFNAIVNAGLGSWIKLPSGDTADVLKTPTEALTDMDRAIASSIEEMAKLGIRMLTPETNQSGVALDIRNASQTAQLGTLNTKVSETMRQVITFMVNWRYNLELKPSDIEFSMSSDFSPTPVGDGWLRLATEWYQGGLIPRTVWIQLLKANDMLPPEYDDEEGQEEINGDELTIPKSNPDFANELRNQDKPKRDKATDTKSMKDLETEKE